MGILILLLRYVILPEREQCEVRSIATVTKRGDQGLRFVEMEPIHRWKVSRKDACLQGGGGSSESPGQGTTDLVL